MFVFRSACADWNYVPSSSMNPSLIAGDRVIVDKLSYGLRVPFTLIEVVRWDSPHRGDVITFDSPRDGLNLIKRVVAVAGDEVEMNDNELTINGVAVGRKLVEQSRQVPSELGLQDLQIWSERSGDKVIDTASIASRNKYRDFPKIKVPQGHLLVLGDSRDNSMDSRFIGFIDVQRVTGQAVRVALSHNPDALYLPRASRWWLPLQHSEQ